MGTRFLPQNYYSLTFFLSSFAVFYTNLLFICFFYLKFYLFFKPFEKENISKKDYHQEDGDKINLSSYFKNI